MPELLWLSLTGLLYDRTSARCGPGCSLGNRVA